MSASSSTSRGAMPVTGHQVCTASQQFAAGSFISTSPSTARLQPSLTGTGGFFQVENVTNVSLGDIAYSEFAYIHPIFSAENFRAENFHYGDIVPALRVASAILRSERSLAFFYTVMCGKCDPPVEGQLEGTLHPTDSVLTDEQKRAAQRKLRMLASIVQFSTMDGRGFDNKNGYTAYTEDNHCKQHPLLPDGCAASIVFSQGFVYAMIADQRAADIGIPDNASRVCNLFSFAKVLCHEVAHAANFAVRGRITTREPFYGSHHSCSELGFDFENAVFGGIYFEMNIRDTKTYMCMRPTVAGPRPKMLGYSKTMLFSPCPVNVSVRGYLALGSPYGVRGLPGFFDLFTRVAIKDLAKFLTSAHWQAEAQIDQVTFKEKLGPLVSTCSPPLSPASSTLAPLPAPEGPKLLFFDSNVMNQGEYDVMLYFIAHSGKGLVMNGRYSMQEVETQLICEGMARQEIGLAAAAKLITLEEEPRGHCQEVGEVPNVTVPQATQA